MIGGPMRRSHRGRRAIAGVAGAMILAFACARPASVPAGPMPAIPASMPSDTAPTGTTEQRFVDSVLALMTLTEKLGQLNQVSGAGAPTGPGSRAVRREQIRRGEIGSFLNVTGADTTRALQRVAMEESRLKIPLLFAHDVIHGFRTIFPVPLAEASTWDPAAAERSARIAAREASAHGVAWTFAPMVDI